MAKEDRNGTPGFQLPQRQLTGQPSSAEFFVYLRAFVVKHFLQIPKAGRNTS